jgi:hypothetical protein
MTLTGTIQSVQCPVRSVFGSSPGPKPVQIENDAHQEGEMVVAGDHVLRAKVQGRGNRGAMILLNERSVSFGNVMGEGRKS